MSQIIAKHSTDEPPLRESAIRKARRERLDDDTDTATDDGTTHRDQKKLFSHRVSDFLFGANGGARYSDIDKQQERTGFSDYLPWMLYRKEDHAYLNTNNTVGYVWECTPLTFAGQSQIQQLESLIRADFPKDTVLQFMCFSDHDVSGFVDAYQRNKTRDDALSRKNIEHYSDFLEAGSDGLSACHGIPVRNFRLFVTLYSKQDLSEDLVSIAEEMLSGSHLNPRRLAIDGLLTFLRNLLNGRKHGGSLGTFDEDLPIRKQVILADTDIDFSTRPCKLGDLYAKCITPKANDKKVSSVMLNELMGGYLGGTDDANQITSPFLWTVSIVFNDLTFTLHQKANMTMMQKSGGSFAAAIKKRMDEFGWAIDKFENDRFVTVIPTLWIFDDTVKKVRESTARAKRMWENKKFAMQEETLLSKSLLIASLPFGLYTDNNNVDKLERYFICHAAAAARYIPIQGDFRGASNPVLAYVGRKGQTIGIDVFDERANNQNFVVAATSGSGKSFLMNNLCANYYASGAMVRICDIGYSYQKLCSTCHGRFMDFGKENVVINPFMGSHRDAEDEQKNRVAAANILAEMVYSASGAALSETEWSLVKLATESTYTSGNVERGVDYAEEWLRLFPALCPDKDHEDLEFARKQAREMAFNLRDFTRKGRYGKFFNGASTFDIASDDFVVLELDQLKGSRELFTVVVMQVMNSVTQDLYLSNRSDRRFILFEEAATFLKKNGVHDLSRLANIIEEGYRRARKYHGSFGVVLQSLVDLESFGTIGDVLLNNAAFKFLLESEDYPKAIKLGLIDYEGLAVDLLKSVRNNKPRYSEMFLDTPMGCGVARLAVDPWNYWMSTSAGGEVARYTKLIEQGRTPLEAISDLSGIPL